MIDNNIKNILKIIARHYNFGLKYLKDSIQLKNQTHTLIIQQKRKEFIIEYNIENDFKIINCFIKDFWDLIIAIITRYELNEVKKKKGFLLTKERYFNEEGVTAIKDWETLKKDLILNQIDQRTLFGNRIEAEYIEGFILIFDSMFYERTNIIKFND